MPSGPRPTSRPGAGPGRGRPRARTAPRSGTDRPAGRATPEQAQEPQPTAAVRRRRRLSPNLTTRAIALVVVLLVLTISYASSLRIYLAQTQDIAATQTEIADRQARISELQGQLTRWNDPAYVSTQARTRLGWVMPGETGFTVIGEDGDTLSGDAELAPEKSAAGKPADAWWSKLWGSVQTADRPAPAKVAPTKPPVITEKTKPSPSAAATPR